MEIERDQEREAPFVGGRLGLHNLPEERARHVDPDGARRGPNRQNFRYGEEPLIYGNYYLPQNYQDYLPDATAASCTFSDGKLIPGMWLPSIRQFERVPDKVFGRRLTLNLPLMLICQILRTLVANIDRSQQLAIPLEGPLPAGWLYNTFLIVNVIYNTRGISTTDRIKTELLPALFVVGQRTVSVREELVRRLTELGRNNPVYINVSPRSGLGYCFERLIRQDRELAQIAKTVISKIYEQKSHLANIGSAFIANKLALANADFEQATSYLDGRRREEIFPKLRGTEQQLPTPLEALRMYSEMDFLTIVCSATNCPLLMVKNAGPELLVDTNPIDLTQIPAGYNPCFGMQITPACFRSSAMFKVESVINRLISGGGALHEMAMTVNGLQNRNRLDVPAERINDQLAVFAPLPNLRFGVDDIALERRLINNNQQVHAAIFGQNQLRPVNQNVDIQLGRVPQVPRERLVENFFHRRNREEANREQEFRPQVRAMYNPQGNHQAENQRPNNQQAAMMVEQHVAERRVRGVDYIDILLNFSRRLAASQEAIDDRYVQLLRCRNRPLIIDAYLNHYHLCAHNPRNGQFAEVANISVQLAQHLGDDRLSSCLGFLMIPNTPNAYQNTVVNDLIGDLDANFYMANEHLHVAARLFGNQVSLRLGELIGGENPQFCLFWRSLSQLEGDGRLLLPQLDQAVPAANDFSLAPNLFIGENVAGSLHALLVDNINALSRHPATIMSDLSLILYPILSFFSPESQQRQQRYYTYCCISVLFTYWTAIICSLIDWAPHEGLEHPLSWVCIRAYFLFTQRFIPEADPRLLIHEGILPAGLRQFILCDVFQISRSFHQLYPGLNILAGRHADTVVLSPVNLDQIARDARRHISRRLEMNVLNGDNRSGFISVLSKIN